MCVKTITAYQDSKGGMYPLETTALIAEAAIQTGASLAIPQGLFGHAAALIPLLQRRVEISTPKSDEKPAEKEPEKDPPAKRRLTDLDLTEQGHTSSCHARATGDELDCNCDVSE